MTPDSKEMSNDEKLNNENAGSRITIVSDPKSIKILVDPMRRKILRTMREGIENKDGIIRKDMTVPEVSRKLGLETPSKLYHHFDLLQEHGFVRVAREEKKKRSSITYYERTSPAFVLATTIDEVEKKEGMRDHPLISLINDAFLLNLSEEKQDKAQQLIDEYTNIQHRYTVKGAEKLKGNIPELRIPPVLGFVSRLYASQNKRCQEILKELMDYIEIDIE